MANPTMKTSLTILLVSIIGTILHEIAHLLAALNLGYEATIRLNSVSPVGVRTTIHAILISAAGPLFTALQGLGGFAIAIKHNSLIGFGVLVGAAMHRSVAALISALSKPNDEMRISLDLGLGPWAVYAIILVILWGLVVYAANKLRPGWSYIFWAWLGVSLGLMTTVFGEPFLPAFKFGTWLG